jgi:hypothetical protein
MSAGSTLSRPADASRPTARPGFDPEAVDVEALDDAYRIAASAGRPDLLPVIGFGQISVAFAWPPDSSVVAVKSLPPFPSHAHLTLYVELLEEYLAGLGGRGIEVVPTVVRSVEAPTRPHAYVLQPLLAAETLLPRVLAGGDHDVAAKLFAKVVACVVAAVDDRVGIDCQVSNWAVSSGRLIFLDVTTPMLRDTAGRDRLDTGPFVASLPWLVRGPVRRFVAPRLLDPYHDPRAALLDLAGNLYRDGLGHLVPLMFEAANDAVSPPLTVGEVRRFARRNEATWASLQRLRRIDRLWQTRVRGRDYPYLLPP